MELTWIEDFLALAACCNFSRAAEQRGVTQPAFGRRVRALENWVGGPLFDRSGHQITLTVAGHAFYPAAEEVLRRLQLGRSQAREAIEGSASAIRFASTPFLASTFFPQWLQAAELAAGRTFSFEFLVEHTLGCERLMRRGEIRLLLCHHHDAAPMELESRAFDRLPLAQDRLVPVSTPDEAGQPLHPLADDSAPITYLAYSPESGVGRILSRSGLIERVQDRLRPAFHSHAVLTLATMAQAGRGLAWLPWSAVEKAVSARSLVRAASENWDVPLEICLIRPRGRQATVLEEFWLQVRKSLLGSVTS